MRRSRHSQSVVLVRNRNRKSSLWAWCFLYVGMLIAAGSGCHASSARNENKHPDPQSSQSPSTSDTVTPPSGMATTDPVASNREDQPNEFRAPRLASWEEIEQWVALQTGKLVVVDLWSTSCGPCLRELPHLVRLSEELEDKVACATVDLDYYGDPDTPPETFVGKVTEVLKKLQAKTENFICRDADEQVFKKLQVASIPVVLVFDKEGKLAKKFTNDANEYGKDGFTYEQHIVPFVRSLLDAP